MPKDESKETQHLLWLIAFPVVVFYTLAFGLTLNLPLIDDYPVALAFSTKLMSLPAGVGRWKYFLAAQQNEYKLYFGHAFVWAELHFLGHLNFRLLSIAGDLSILLLLYVLWKLFLPGEADKVRRLTLFVPVPFLIAQFQYWETINWPLPTLQNLSVLGFSLGAIYLLGKRTDGAWWGAAGLSLLAVSASGNGFLVLPVGVLMLLLQRRWVGLLGWSMTGAGAVWIYSYHYVSVTQTGKGSMVEALLHPKLIYMMVFLGTAGATPVRVGAYPAGFAIVTFLLWMAWRGYPKRNPVVSSCILFCVLTALGVAGIRSDHFDLVTAVSSRYTMYSDLLLVFCWYAAVEEFLLRSVVPIHQNRTYRIVVGLAMLFWLGNTTIGARASYKRNLCTKHGILLYEHPEMPREGVDGPVYVEPHIPVASWTAFELLSRNILDAARAAGVYELPK